MRKLFFGLFLLMPIIVVSQNYEQQGDECFDQALYDKAVKKYRAAIEMGGSNASINKKYDVALKCEENLRHSIEAENANNFADARYYYQQLLELHPLPLYENKVKKYAHFHNHATNSNEGLLLNLQGTIGTAPGTLIFNDDDKYYTYQLSSGTVKRTIKLLSRDGATLVFESYDKSGKYIGKFVGNWSNGIYSGIFTNYKNISINFKLRNK